MYTAYNPCLSNESLCEYKEHCVFNSKSESLYDCGCPPFMQVDTDGRTCIDINECLNPSLYECKELEKCVNIQVSGYSQLSAGYECQCKEGYKFDVGIHQCIDIDECETHCLYASRCTNLIGSFSCECLHGFSGNGESCENINECEYVNCGNGGECVNTAGSFYCKCPRGFIFKNGSCEDINECDQPVIKALCVPPMAQCINKIGGYVCVCNMGDRVPKPHQFCASMKS